MHLDPTRRAFLASAAVTSLAGCAGGLGGRAQGSRPTIQPATRGTVDENAKAEFPVAERSLPLPAAGESLRGEARSGGPPKDGIPSIDSPRFEPAAEVGDRIADGDIVFGVARGGKAKAYPQYILVTHEIVNDVIDGDPVSVTYCPLTGTAQGFNRGSTTFGVSGRLLNNNLIMYDRATENWWPQVLATSIPGPWNTSLSGSSLTEFRVIWTTWQAWRSRYPETRVLTEDTGHVRNYRRDPYGTYNPKGGYYSSDHTLFPRLNEDDRFHPKHVVMGVRTPNGAAAVPKPQIRDLGVVEGAIGDRPILWAYDGSLDTAYAYRNPDGRRFEHRGDDVEGPDGRYRPAELPLDRLVTFDAMWFAWSGFYPNTSVHG